MRRVVCVALVGLVAAIEAGSGQQLRGRLLDLETNRPIAAGLLTLLDADSTRVATVVTDTDGVWRFDAPASGRYYVAAERLGYRSWVAGPIEIGAADALNSVFHLQPMPVELAAIDVQAIAMRRHLEYNGFFERQRSNFGHFVTPEAIERRQAARVTDLLRAIPGVRVVATGGGSAGRTEVQLRGSSLSQGGLCRPRIFVDGLIYNRGDARPIRDRPQNATEQAYEDALRRTDGLSLDDIGHTSTIAAIEVYRSASQVPVQFGGSSIETLCGVIVVWTRTGRMRTGGR
jgi:hypothetical protein